MGCKENNSQLHKFSKNVSPTPLVICFSRSALAKSNHFGTRIGLFRSETHKWGMASTAACECGAEEQAAENVILSCPIYHHLNGFCALSHFDKSLATSQKEIYPATWGPSSSRPSPSNNKKKDYFFRN